MAGAAMTDLADCITFRAERSLSDLNVIKSGAITMAADPNTTAEQWGHFANFVAEAEGTASLWARLAQFITNRPDSNKDDINEIVLNILTGGADDGWSGRGNDLKRARFDGVKHAASDIRWL